MQGRLVPAGAQLRIEEAPIGKIENNPKNTISIVWETRELIAIAKPSGLPTEPTQRGSAGVASEQLRSLLRARGDTVSFLAAVHRLDVETSGVVLFATHQEAAAQASAAFRQGQVLRRYLAVVDRAPEFQTRSFREPIARVPGNKRLYACASGGKEARTDVRVYKTALEQTVTSGQSAIEPGGGLLYVEPYTGRTHQIRVHLANAGHPITGDTRYGGKRNEGFGLHALGLSIPWNSSWIHLEAPLSPTFLQAADAYRWNAPAIQCASHAWGVDNETKEERCLRLP